jgi:hypothetical protein
MTSSLNPDLITGKDRQLGKGHGIDALGPSDLSDSGSDIAGGPGWQNEDELDLGLDTGTTSDPEAHAEDRSAGGDVGDSDLDSDSDAAGTGEKATAGRDSKHAAGRDIDTDQVEHLSDLADPADSEPGDDDRP